MKKGKSSEEGPVKLNDDVKQRKQEKIAKHQHKLKKTTKKQ